MCPSIWQDGVMDLQELLYYRCQLDSCIEEGVSTCCQRTGWYFFSVEIRMSTVPSCGLLISPCLGIRPVGRGLDIL